MGKSDPCAIVLVLALGATGCGKGLLSLNGSSTVSTPNLSGLYSGTWAGKVGNTTILDSTFTGALLQKTNDMAGTWIGTGDGTFGSVCGEIGGVVSSDFTALTTVLTAPLTQAEAEGSFTGTLSAGAGSLQGSLSGSSGAGGALTSTLSVNAPTFQSGLPFTGFYNGSWSGTVSAGALQETAVEMTLIQSATSLGGVFVATGNGVNIPAMCGLVTGTVSGATASLTFSFAQPLVYLGTASGTFTLNGTALTGAYARRWAGG